VLWSQMMVYPQETKDIKGKCSLKIQKMSEKSVKKVVKKHVIFREKKLRFFLRITPQTQHVYCFLFDRNTLFACITKNIQNVYSSKNQFYSKNKKNLMRNIYYFFIFHWYFFCFCVFWCFCTSRTGFTMCLII